MPSPPCTSAFSGLFPGHRFEHLSKTSRALRTTPQPLRASPFRRFLTSRPSLVLREIAQFSIACRRSHLSYAINHPSGGTSCESRTPEFFRVQPPRLRDAGIPHASTIFPPSLSPLISETAPYIHCVCVQFRCYMSPQFLAPSYVFTASARRLALGKDGPKD
jgi:hypothetical protein